MYTKYSLLYECLFVVLLSCSPSNAWAQVEQPGIVLEYNEKLAKTPLDNVEILVSGAGQRVSAEDGTFTLRFHTKKVGEHVEVQEIAKLDYELFNRDAVEQWNITGEKRPFTIVMCKSSRFKKIKDNLNKISSESYAKQLKTEQEKLKAERKAGKLKEAEYHKRLQALQDEFDKQTESIRPYIDRFARIDLSELSAKEREIVLLIQKGKTEKAIEEYKKLDLERKVINNRQDYQKLKEASEAVENAKQKRQEERDSLVAQIRRKNDALMLIGGEENLKSVEESCRQIAESDTTYLYGLSAYSSFLIERGRYQENLRYEHLIVKCGEREFPQHLSSMYHSLAYTYLHLDNYEQADKYIEKCLEANELYNKKDSLTYQENLSSYYAVKANIAQHNDDIEQEGLLLAQDVDITRKLFSINQKKYVSRLIMSLQMQLQFEVKHRPEKADAITEEINQLFDMESDSDADEKKAQEAFLLFTLGNTSLQKGDSETCIKIIKLSANILEPLYKKDREKYGMYGTVLAIIGSQLAEQKKYAEAQPYLEKALPICKAITNKTQNLENLTSLTTTQLYLGIIKSNYGYRKEAESLLDDAWMNIQEMDSMGIKPEQRLGYTILYLQNMAQHYLWYEDYKKAEGWLKIFLDMNQDFQNRNGDDYAFPGIWYADYNLGVICYRQKRYSEAEKYMLPCIMFQEDDVTEKEMQAVRFFLIESLSEQGKYDDGLKYVELFLETVKGEERLHCLHAKGVFLLKKGNIDEAKAIWNEIKDHVNDETRQWSILRKTFEGDGNAN